MRNKKKNISDIDVNDPLFEMEMKEAMGMFVKLSKAAWLNIEKEFPDMNEETRLKIFSNILPSILQLMANMSGD